MDNRKNNGGKREGAGRKSKSEEMQLIEMLNKHIDKDDAIKKLKSKIDEGDFKALQMYFNYMYGKPYGKRNQRHLNQHRAEARKNMGKNWLGNLYYKDL